MTQGVDTQEGFSRIAKLETETDFLKKSFNDRLDTINSIANQEIAKLDIVEGQRDEEKATRLARIDKIIAEKSNAILTNLLIEAQTKSTNQSIEESKQKVSLMNAEINKMANDVAQGWANLDIKERELALRAWVEDVKAEYPGVWNVFGRMLNDAGNALGDMLGKRAVTDSNPIEK